MYDKIEALEAQLVEAKAHNSAIESEKVTGYNIYKVLIYFESCMLSRTEGTKRAGNADHVIAVQEREPSGEARLEKGLLIREGGQTGGIW